MVGKTLLEFPPLHEGILVKRYKRFLADVRLKDGSVITAHCPNTGPMKGVLYPGRRVRLNYCPSPSRKLNWTWEQAEVPIANNGTCWVGVNTLFANKLIRILIEKGFLEEYIGPFSNIRNEVPYGELKKSRIDLLVEPKPKNIDLRTIYIEVKNTTWVQGERALFPDTVTERGQKHLRELRNLVPVSRGVLIPCICRSDVSSFSPGDSADKNYGTLFRKAIEAGVEVIPCSFGFYRDHITWEGIKKVFVNDQHA